MDISRNIETNEYVKAIFVENDTSYIDLENQTWYINVAEIESYDHTKVLDISKVECKYKKGTNNIRNMKGTIYDRSPCFFIPNKKELGINFIPESPTHIKIKNWVYNQITKKKLILIYSSIKHPVEYDNTIKISDLDINWHKTGMEFRVTNTKTQVADILVQFNQKHPILGEGISFEIQLSKQHENTKEERTRYWAINGYSVVWLGYTDFEKLGEDFNNENNTNYDVIELKENKVRLKPYLSFLEEYYKEKHTDLLLEIQKASRDLDKKFREGINPICIGPCPKCAENTTNKRKIGYLRRVDGPHGTFYACSNYRDTGCRYTINNILI